MFSLSVILDYPLSIRSTMFETTASLLWKFQLFIGSLGVQNGHCSGFLSHPRNRNLPPFWTIKWDFVSSLKEIHCFLLIQKLLKDWGALWKGFSDSTPLTQAAWDYCRIPNMLQIWWPGAQKAGLSISCVPDSGEKPMWGRSRICWKESSDEGSQRTQFPCCLHRLSSSGRSRDAVGLLWVCTGFAGCTSPCLQFARNSA